MPSPRSGEVTGRRGRERQKFTERNIPAAACALLTLVTLAASLAEPRWFRLKGGGCSTNSVGIFPFFTSHGVQEGGGKLLMFYGSRPDQVWVDCVTSRVVAIMQSIISLVLLSCVLQLFCFVVNLIGPSQRHLRFLKRNSILEIITVILCVALVGLCLWVTELIYELQLHTRHHRGARVSVLYDVAFYMLVAGGACAILGAMCNLLRRYPPGNWLDAQARIRQERRRLCASEADCAPLLTDRPLEPDAPLLVPGHDVQHPFLDAQDDALLFDVQSDPPAYVP